jgi:glycine/D-amino acid oxidase-like deaminating enzyme
MEPQSRVPVPHPTKSFWLDGADLQDYCSPFVDSHIYDVAIIGCGMSGVSTAYWLLNNGITNVILIDSRGICSGATGRNGGHMWALWPDEDICRLKSKACQQNYEFQLETIKLMKDFIKTNQIDCDFYENGSVSATKDRREAKEWQEWVENEIDSKKYDISLLEKSELEEKTSSSKYVKGVYERHGSQFNPTKFTLALAKIVINNGINIQTNTTVLEILRESSEPNSIYNLKTDRDEKIIRAAHVVHATNGYCAKLLPNLKDVVYPVRGQCVITSPLQKFRIPSNLELNYGKEYLTHRGDGRIILGGMRWKSPMPTKKEKFIVDDSVVVPEISHALRQFLNDEFPEIKGEEYKITHEWTGIMGWTPDELPLVGCLSELAKTDRIVLSGETILAGYTGNGMPNCFGVAKVIAETIVGKVDPNKVVPWYNPDRYLKKLAKK